MSEALQLEFVLRIVLAAILGGIIGLEREMKNHSAGLRTHVLVAVGSALVVIVSRFAFVDSAGMPMGDPGRIAAQVVSGIGFIGAGTILHNDNRIKGLTTAATLWLCSSVGLSIGGGLYIIGISTAVLSVIALIVLDKVQKKIFKRQFRTLIISFYDSPRVIGSVNQILSNNNVVLRSINVFTPEDDGGTVKASLLLRLPQGLVDRVLSERLSYVPNLIYTEWEDGRRYSYRPEE